MLQYIIFKINLKLPIAAFVQLTTFQIYYNRKKLEYLLSMTFKIDGRKTLSCNSMIFKLLLARI